MPKAKQEEPVKQQYVVLVPISSVDGKTRWMPGSLIELDDERAAIHLAKGNVAPLDNTVPPVVDVGPALVVHEPESN
jgi:hypothetical protein